MNLYVCVSGCVPELFENTLQLRERRMDLEELLVEERKSAEALKKECDTLVKKVVLCFFIFSSCHTTCNSHPTVCVCVFLLLGSSGEIGEEQSEESGGRLGVS